MRAVQRTADKVCATSEERTVFIKLGALIMDEPSEENVKKIFAVLGGDCQFVALPENLQRSVPKALHSVNTKKWKDAKSWVQWWTRPTHLSEL